MTMPGTNLMTKITRRELVGLYDMMNRFRGMECGVKFAEGFVRHTQTVPLDPRL